MTTVTSAVSSSPATVPARASLDFEQARCERQLSDWQHCVSAKTPYGKAKIEELTARLGTIQTQVKQADAARTETARATAPADAQGGSTAPVGALGGQLDVFA